MCSALPWKLAFQLSYKNSQAKLPIHRFSLHKPSSNTPPQMNSLWQWQCWWVKRGQGVLLKCEHNSGHGFGHGFSPGQQAAPVQCLAGSGEQPERSGCSNADVVRVWLMPRPFGRPPATHWPPVFTQWDAITSALFFPFPFFFSFFFPSTYPFFSPSSFDLSFFFLN